MSNIVHFINLKHRTDRLEKAEQEFKEQGIESNRWEGIIYGETFTERRKGVNAAHRQIVQYAKDNKLPYIIIAEDDIRFFQGESWKFYLDNMPKSFDIYLGMIYTGKIENNRLASAASGFILYTVHERFYDTFLSCPVDKHIDRELTNNFNKYEFMVCPEFVCEQRLSKSDNSGQTVDLRKLLEGRKIFGNPKLYTLPL
jgi:hypothetical protein